MKALVLSKAGAKPEMVIEERPIPVVKKGYSLIKVHAATVNPLSNQIRLGIVPQATIPLVLSNDGSGIIKDSQFFSKGTRVAIYGGADMGITKDGLQQEWVLVQDSRIIELPENFSLDEGAAFPINYVTAYQALTRVGQLKAGQKILVSGATGSLGNALLQTSKALGASPIAIVSHSSKVQRAKNAGADHVIDLSTEDLTQAVLALTNNQGADLAFDSVAGDLFLQLLKSVRTRGAIVSIGFAGGMAPNFDVVDLVVFEKKILGYDAHLETPEDIQTAIKALQQFIRDEKIRPFIDSTYSIDEYEEAYKRLTSRQAKGTILLRL